MAQTVNLWGATYNNVPAIDVPSTGDTTAKFTDASITTAVEADVAQGKIFIKADGSQGTGTATGTGGSVTQDQDGFIVLPPDGGGSPSVGGLVYETGTWTPSADISDTTISFTNAHTDAPILAMICDSDTSERSANSNVFSIIGNLYGFLGFYVEQGSSTRYGVTIWNYVNSSDGLSVSNLSFSFAEVLETWMSSSGFRAYTNSESRYWRANRTYKWIAVWAPTT